MESTSTQKHTTTGVDLARIREAIAPVLSAHGISLVDLAWLTEQGGWVLRVTIEREGSVERGGGVTLDDCADVSREVSALLDADDPIAPHYNLEVSSPGVDRPLRTEAELARFVGQTAKVKLSRPAPDGQRLLRGALAEAPAGRVAVIVDGKRVEVAFADVAQPKKGKASTREPGAPHAKRVRAEPRKSS